MSTTTACRAGICSVCSPTSATGSSESLAAAGIDVGVHFQPSYAYPMFGGEPLPGVESFWRRVVSLPVHLALTDDDVDRVIDDDQGRLVSRLLVLGTGTLAIEIADVAAESGFEVAGFVENLDRGLCASPLEGLPVHWIDDGFSACDATTSPCAGSPRVDGASTWPRWRLWVSSSRR